MNEGGKEGDTMNQPRGNVVLMFFVFFSILFGLRVMLAQQKQVPAVKSQKPPTSGVVAPSIPQKPAAAAPAVPSQQPAVGKWTATKISVPVAGKSYKVLDLLNNINTNNPSKTSTFILPVNGSQIVGDAQCWSVGVDKQGRKIISNITGSRSAANAGMTALITANLNSMVQLRADPVLLDHLFNIGCFADLATKVLYGRVLLYFVIQGYRFYICEVYPALVRKMAFGMINPAQDILNKWDFTKAF